MPFILFLLCAIPLFAGTLTKHQFRDSKIFPGTQRDYWIYLPDGYDPEKSACLMVFQDGGSFLRKPGTEGYVPEVFEALIQAGEMPMTVGLFVNPGVVPATREGAQPRFNRSYEYDSMGPNYANFLIEELIPSLDLNLSENPDDRGICGASSGAIAAFTVAWERPDHFRRVYSMIGTYVGLRGGNDYPTLIRQTEPKPLRIFLQGGSNDLNIYGGDWWMANQTMQRALEFSGYEQTHRWDDGGHNRKGGNAVLKEALRWLWKDHGKVPVQTHLEKCRSRAAEYLIPGEDWQLVSEGHNWSEGLAITTDGTLYITDVPDSELFRVSPDGTEYLVVKDTNKANGIALGPDGKTLYTASQKEIRAIDLATGKHQLIAEGPAGSNDIVVSNSGHLYFSAPRNRKVYHVNLATGKRSEVAHLDRLNGLGLSADQTQLFVCQFHTRQIYAFTIDEKTGKLSNKQPYFYAQAPTDGQIPGLDGQCTSASGLLLVGTEAGLQIFDQPGRVQLVLPRPAYEDDRVNYCRLFQDTLYIATRHRVYKRKVKLQAAPAWQPPVDPKRPRL